MTQHKVIADDSLSAMDEISRVLGKDAVILKTQKINGKIEILGSNNIEDIDKGSLKVLSKLEFTKNGINSLMKYNSEELMSPRDAARNWLGTHPNTVEYLFDTSED